MHQSLFSHRPRVIVGAAAGAAVQLADQLRAAGCRVTTVRSARDALAAAAAQQPDLLLLPASGLRATAEQRAARAFASSHPGCAVLLLGGGATSVLAQAVGAADVIERPFALASAMERVRHALEEVRRTGP